MKSKKFKKLREYTMKHSLKEKKDFLSNYIPKISNLYGFPKIHMSGNKNSYKSTEI